MKRKTVTKIISLILIVVTISSCLMLPSSASPGWQPIFTYHGPLNLYKIDVSPLHYGYASPTHGSQYHQNFVIYTVGMEVMNVHLYIDPTNPNCVCGWESHTGAYHRYCDGDLKRAAESVLTSIKSTFQDVVGWVQWAAVGAAVTAAIAKIIQWIQENYWVIYCL